MSERDRLAEIKEKWGGGYYSTDSLDADDYEWLYDSFDWLVEHLTLVRKQRDELNTELRKVRGQSRRAMKRIESCWKHTTCPDDACTCGASAAQKILKAVL